jgi:hypothetical protein
MKNPTYVISCRRGLNKLTCPLILQQGILCVECGNALYIRREPEPEENNTENNTEQKQDE